MSPVPVPLSAFVGAAAAATAVLCAGRSGTSGRARLPSTRRGTPGRDPAPGLATARAARPAPRLPPPVAVAVAAIATWLLAGPRTGPALALGVGLATHRALRALPSRAATEQDRARAAAVPLLADIVAACLAAGTTMDAALAAAAAATSGPLAVDVSAAVRAMRVGLPPALAWAPLLDPDRPAAVRAFARAVARATEHGAAPASLLRTVADDTRAAARHAGEVAARRAAVAAVLPLGCCFLPAFVLLGVVPLLAGMAAVVPR
jgi:pilus assembly protein TadC